MTMLNENEITDIFNIEKESLNYTNNLYKNGSYGVAYSLLNYVGEDPEKSCLTCPIEHGLLISGQQMVAEESINCSNYIITNSLHSEKRIEKVSEKKVIKIGPYIEYATSVIAEHELQKLKELYGRTLLVFPTHGIKGYGPQFSIEIFIEEIERVRKSFDTVLVCMYFYDILCNHHKPYEKMNYIIVCAGNESNKFFLNKLKTIICLSDAVISNAYTTGLQYAIHMKKPVYIVNGLDLLFVQEENSFNNIDKLDEDVREWNKLKDFYSMCVDSSFGSLSLQRKWGNDVFGLDQIKSRQDMKKLLAPVIRRF